MKGARTWKRILNEGLPPNDVLAGSPVEGLESAIITAPIVVGPELDDEGGKAGDYEWARYKSLAIPFPVFWCEWQQRVGIMPRHVCRGHFAEYGPEFNKGLLFGKYAGRFYIPPHLKGDKKNGVVDKDYMIPAGN